jgi:hypothetical protein
MINPNDTVREISHLFHLIFFLFRFMFRSSSNSDFSMKFSYIKILCFYFRGPILKRELNLLFHRNDRAKTTCYHGNVSSRVKKPTFAKYKLDKGNINSYNLDPKNMK